MLFTHSAIAPCKQPKVLSRVKCQGRAGPLKSGQIPARLYSLDVLPGVDYLCGYGVYGERAVVTASGRGLPAMGRNRRRAEAALFVFDRPSQFCFSFQSAEPKCPV